MSNITKADVEKLVKIMHLSYLRVIVLHDCNVKCVFCHHEGICDANLQAPKLTFEEYDDIANYFEGIFDKVVITGGEPLIYKNLEKIISIFADKNYTVNMVTNGILLDENRQKSIFESGLNKINVSVHTLNEQEYKQVYGTSSYMMNKVKDNLTTAGKYLKTNINAVILDNSFERRILELAKFTNNNNLDLSVFFAHSLNQNPTLHTCLLKFMRDNFEFIETEKFQNARSLNKFANGNNIITYDVLGESKNNNICQICHKTTECNEGAYALRLTPKGDLKPCLARNDNLILKENYLSNFSR
jgi:cyclic pyranopterin phosphate synthase